MKYNYTYLVFEIFFKFYCLKVQFFQKTRKCLLNYLLTPFTILKYFYTCMWFYLNVQIFSLCNSIPNLIFSLFSFSFGRFMNLRISTLKECNVISPRVNVLDSILFYMKIPKSECDVEIDDLETVKQIYWKLYNFYLKREMQIDDDSFRKMKKEDYLVSFRLLRDNLYLMKKSFGFTNAEVRSFSSFYWFFFHHTGYLLLPKDCIFPSYFEVIIIENQKNNFLSTVADLWLRSGGRSGAISNIQLMGFLFAWRV